MQKIKLPKIIILYTALFGLFGLVSGLWGLVEPMKTIAVLDVTLKGTDRNIILYFYSIRNITFGILFFLALFKYRTKEVFLTIYITRFILNLSDGIVMFSSGHLQKELVPFGLIFLFVLLLPIPFVIYYLQKLQ